MDVHCRVCLATHALDEAGSRRLVHFRCPHCNSLHFLRRSDVGPESSAHAAAPATLRSAMTPLHGSGVYPATTADRAPAVACDVEAFGLDAHDVDAFDVSASGDAAGDDDDLDLEAPTVRQQLPQRPRALSA